MNKFESVLLYSPDLTKTNLSKIEENFKKLLEKSNGSIITEEDWGLRDLSYNIKNNKKAFYKFYQLEIDGKEIPNIKDSINKVDQIIRYLFIKVKDHSELPTKLMNIEN
tara:strand:- start:228 stop:554 length:327 start_codon:yes stop_codon:yes gene_type:complete